VHSKAKSRLSLTHLEETKKPRRYNKETHTDTHSTHTTNYGLPSTKSNSVLYMKYVYYLILTLFVNRRDHRACSCCTSTSAWQSVSSLVVRCFEWQANLKSRAMSLC